MTSQSPFFEINREEFNKALPLCAESRHLQFTIEAAMHKSPMRIWLDNRNHPTCGFMWDNAWICYFIGKPLNSTFIIDSIEFIKSEIKSHNLAKNIAYLKISYSSPEWEIFIESQLQELVPLKEERVFLVLKDLKNPEWSDMVQNNYKIQKITQKILSSDIDGVESIKDEINQMWENSNDFFNFGFGYYLLKEEGNKKSIEGWCTGEYFRHLGNCGIGIEVFPGYQKRGFGTALGSAFVQHALSIGIKPFWETSQFNEASIRTAKKIGFSPIQYFSVYICAFQNIEAHRANYYFKLKDYNNAARWYEKAAVNNEKKLWYYYNAACSWALVDELDNAFRNLKEILKLEFTLIELKKFTRYLKDEVEFINLHKSPKWNILLEEIEKKEISYEKEKSR